MSEVKHTPLPWAVEEGHVQRDSGGIRYWQIHDGQDAIACNQFCYAGYNQGINAANAAFIVQACNSHYALIEALDRVLERGYVSKYIDEEREDHALIVAALSLAKGEQA